MIRVDHTAHKGLGVFAEKRFGEGEVIERAPAIVLPAGQWAQVEQTLLANYCYLWGDQMAVVYGCVMVYNHSYSPNARYRRRADERIMEIVAQRDIEAGEEILVNYNGLPDDDTPVWFDVRD
jgi:uncharacterized protein